MALFRRRKPEQGEQSGNENDAAVDGGQSKASWKRPANTAFKQQRLKAWQPILTPKTVLPTFLALGILFGPIGGLLIWGSGLVTEMTFDYTNCGQQAAASSLQSLTFQDLPTYDYKLKSGSGNPTITPPQWAFFTNATTTDETTKNACVIQFDVPIDIDHSVFMYYKLTQFYQNHRRYVKSLSTDQLKGKGVSAGSLGDCSPLDKDSNGKAIYPCGLIANSIFNDTINNPVLLTAGSNQTYNFTSDGIAWPGEAKKYATVPGYDPSEIVPPPNWHAKYPNGYTSDNLPDLHNDQHFQNWMRTAGLPTFTKLYGRNDNETMVKGRYQMLIYSNFPVTPYGGTKSIVISSVSWVGGKNPFLGWAYVGTSILLVLLAVVGTARHCLKPRRLGDMTQLSWNQPATAR